MVALYFLLEQYLKHGSLWAAQLVEWGFPSGHLYNGTAQGPDICWLSISPRALVYNLRSHVLQSA